MEDSAPGPGPVQVLDPQPGVLYSLDAVVHLTGVSRRSILVYCKSRLIEPATNPETEGMSFSDEAIYRIRQIEQLRSEHGINLAGIRIIMQLSREIRRLEDEMRFLRTSGL